MIAKSWQWKRTMCLALCSLAIVWASGESPAVEILPKQEKQTSPMNQPYALTCRGSQENPSLFSDLRWIDPRGEEVKNGDRMKVTTDSGRVTLYFIQPTDEDSGVYKCTGKFQNTEVKTSQVQITFYQSITWEECNKAQALVLGRQGEKIKCRVTARPSPSVTWKKDGKRLEEDRYVIENDAIAVKGEVDEIDGGEYEVAALVENTGSLDFRKIVVSVYVEPKIDELPDDDFAVEGQEKRLQCKASGRPDPVYSWFGPLKRNLSSEPGYIVDRISGQLTILKTNKEENKGEFQCVVENAAGRAEKKVQLQIRETPKLVSYPNISVVEGEEATLECKFSGMPLPTLSMRKERETQLIITDGKHNVEQRNESTEAMLKVSIKNLNRDDGGLYYCIAENSVASVEQAGHLQVEFKPDVSKTNDAETTWDKRAVNLTCVVNAVPNASVTWYKNERIIDESDIYKIYNDPVGGRYRLRVTPIDQTVYGYYDCKAQNSRGEMSARINLIEGHRPDAPGRVEIRNSTPTAIKFVISDVRVTDRLPVKSFIVEYKETKMNFPQILRHVYRTNLADENSLNGLTPNTEYSLRVALVNDVGEGDFSIEYFARTADKSVPTVPKIIIDDHFRTATGGDITSDFDTRFDIKWLPSEDNGSPIKAYMLRYIKVVNIGGSWRIVEGEEWKEAFAEPGASSYSLRDLEAATTYKVELLAQNEIGASSPYELVFNTKGSESSTQSNPSVQQPHSQSNVTLAIVITLLIVIVILLIMDIIFYVRCQVGLTYFIRTHLCGAQSISGSKGKGDEAGTGRGGTEKPNEELTPMMINGSHGGQADDTKKPVMPKDSQV